MRLAPGNLFERYRIEELVGRGGMGEVYAAVDTRLHRRVALKVIRPDKYDASEGVERFLREARAAAALNHPGSVAVYELGEAEGIPYIAMELVDGVSLKEHSRATGRIFNVDLATRVRWLVDIARALSAAHKVGLVHRDIKPSNVMVSRDGQVKVLDFGLAKAMKLDAAAGGFQTGGDAKLGTPRYMSPEQLEGNELSAASDQWALGTTAYELLSHTYSGGALAGRPAPLDTIAPEVPIDLAIVVARMIERDPAARYPSMDAVATELAACLPLLEPKPVEASPDTDRSEGKPSTVSMPETKAMPPVGTFERTVPLAPALRLPKPAIPTAGGTVRLASGVAEGVLARAHAKIPEPRPSAPSVDDRHLGALDSGSGIRAAGASAPQIPTSNENVPRQDNRGLDNRSQDNRGGFVVLAVVVVVLTVIAGAAGAWIMR